MTLCSVFEYVSQVKYGMKTMSFKWSNPQSLESVFCNKLHLRSMSHNYLDIQLLENRHNKNGPIVGKMVIFYVEGLVC